MNKLYKTVYDVLRGVCIAVSEHSKCRGKPSKNSTVAVLVGGVVGMGVLSTAQATVYSGDLVGDCVICSVPADGIIITEGNITSTGHAIFAVSNQEVRVTTAAGKVLSSPFHAIHLQGTGGGTAPFDLIVNNHSDIYSGDASIIVENHQTGGVVINNSGNVTDTVTNGLWGISSGLGNVTITNSGRVRAVVDGIYGGAEHGDVAISSQGSVFSESRGIAAEVHNGKVTIDANASTIGGQYGIEALAVEGQIVINTTESVGANAADNYYNSYVNIANPRANSHTRPAAIFAHSNLASIDIRTAAGKDITSVGNGIEVMGDTNAVRINNASNITTTSYIRDHYNCAQGLGCDLVNAAESVAGNGIDVSTAWAGSTIVNSGNINVATGGLVIQGGYAADKVTSNAGVLNGNLDLGAGQDSLLLSGGALRGSVLMGADDDTLTVKDAIDMTQAVSLSGDSNLASSSNQDVLNMDNITLHGYTATQNAQNKGTNLVGWEQVNVQNKGMFKLTGDLFKSSNTGTLNIDNTSTVDVTPNLSNASSIFGDVRNAGLMTMQERTPNDVTTITGQYTGVAGSRLALDTVLGDDASATDRLLVNGNTSGTTALAINNIGGTGAQTVNGINVVQVNGTSAAGSFTLPAPIQAGSYEYVLRQGSAVDANDWYLTSTLIRTCANTPSLCPVDPQPPYEKPIYRPQVANYLAPRPALLSTLHQRMGEQRSLTTDKAQTWGQKWLSGENSKGHDRFEYEQNQFGVQFGRDIMHTTNAAGRQQRSGATIQYAHSNINASDRVRSGAGLSTGTGSVQTNTIGLGGYYTSVAQDGAYVDGTAQLNRVRSKFTDSYGGRAYDTAWQAAVSAEVGKPVGKWGDWSVEPQAQLSYTYTQGLDLTDKYSHVSSKDNQQLRARLGLRLHKEVLNSVYGDKRSQYYSIVNLQHDLLKPAAVHLHNLSGTESVRVREKFDRTSVELGFGIQGQWGKTTFIHADARYAQSLRGDKHEAKLTLGLKSSF
ncbi:MAG: autotransporter outer membrane beta-barrel domain-containing protein [Formosimonas sp.]